MAKALDLPGLVIFDCDGTLVDSSHSNRLFYNGIKTGLGLPPMTPEEEAYSFIQTIAKTLERIIPESLLASAFEAVEVVDWADLAGSTRLQQGVAEFIDHLKKAGILTAVNTNGSQEVHTILGLLEIKTLFDLIVSADDVARPKPDPEGVATILDRLNIESSRTVYIGDSIIDQQTAQRAGIAFWAYRCPDIEAGLHFDDYRELKKYLSG